MKLVNKKRTTKLTASGKIVVGLIVLIVISITTQLYIRVSDRATRNELLQIQADTEIVKKEIKTIRAELQAIHDHMNLAKLSTLDFMDVYLEESNKTTDILLTNYWTGDGSSGDMTASGLNSKDFKVNEDGMYTYDDKIVVATANTTRLDWAIYKGYKSHELYDELTLTFNDKTYEAVVLDVCGACYGVSGETQQRYDIFTVGNVIGKKQGVLHE